MKNNILFIFSALTTGVIIAILLSGFSQKNIEMQEDEGAKISKINSQNNRGKDRRRVENSLKLQIGKNDSNTPPKQMTILIRELDEITIDRDEFYDESGHDQIPSGLKRVVGIVAPIMKKARSNEKQAIKAAKALKKCALTKKEAFVSVAKSYCLDNLSDLAVKYPLSLKKQFLDTYENAEPFVKSLVRPL